MTVEKNRFGFLSWWLQLLLWCCALFAGFQIFGATGHDDPHINFWFARTLLDNGEMVNYNGDRFQQTTSVLLVLVTALFGAILPFDLITSGYLVDILSALLCCVLVTGMARRAAPSLAGWVAWLTLGSASFFFWSFGGMGSVLAACCMLLCIQVWHGFITQAHLHSQHWLALLLVTAAMALVRPEMPLITLAVSLFLLLWYWHENTGRQRIVFVVLFNALAFAGLFLWQKLYFGTWLPLPVLAKQSGDLMTKLLSGRLYVFAYTQVNPVLLLAWCTVPWVFWHCLRTATARVPGDAMQRLWLLLLSGFFGAHYGFVWLSGGDWMQAGRFLVPVIPVASLLLVMVAGQCLRRRWWAGVLVLCVIASGLRWLDDLVGRSSHGVPVWVEYRQSPAHDHYSVFERYNQEHLRDMAVIDHLQEIIPPLHRALGRRVRVLSGQGGMVYYRVAEALPGQAFMIDLRGLVEGSLTLCPLVKDVRRTAMGLAWNYPEFLQYLPALQAQCGFAAPDIIYDLNSLHESFEPDFVRAGYTMIHREEGYVILNRLKMIPSNMLMVPNVIFVRNELLPLLGNPGVRVVYYRELPLQHRLGNSQVVAFFNSVKARFTGGNR